MKTRRRRGHSEIDIHGVDLGEVLCLQAGVDDRQLERDPALRAHLESLWEAVGDELMPLADAPEGDDYREPAGRRPWAWWRFEIGLPKPASADEERRQLAQLGALAPWERHYLGPHDTQRT